MPTAIVTHKDCILHDTGINHPESKERLIAVNKTLKEFKSKKIKWFKGEKIESKYFFTVHSKNYFKYIKNKSPKEDFFKIFPKNNVDSFANGTCCFKSSIKTILAKNCVRINSNKILSRRLFFNFA